MSTWFSQDGFPCGEIATPEAHPRDPHAKAARHDGSHDSMTGPEVVAATVGTVSGSAVGGVLGAVVGAGIAGPVGLLVGGAIGTAICGGAGAGIGLLVDHTFVEGNAPDQAEADVRSTS